MNCPSAIPTGDTDWIFSGSIVVDMRNNTSGFGNGLDGQPPPSSAIYTDASTSSMPEQEQALAG